MRSFILTVLFCIPAFVQSNDEWSYEQPKQWMRKNRYCAGHSQSPINLRFNVSQFDRRLKQLSFEERQSNASAEFVNNGHTAQLNLNGRYVLKNVAPESEEYNVEQIHFHWGHSGSNVNGSEHLREGQSYPLEVHVVTYSSLYTSLRSAMRNTRSLAVVGAFFELSGDDDNQALQPLVNALTSVRSQNDRVSFAKEFDLKALIGDERLGRYYRYDGSLTTPPCFESVIWTVLLEPLKISRRQLHAFHQLQDHRARIIGNTYRAVKPLGTRKLFRSFHSEDIDEDRQQRMAFSENNGPVLKIDMKLVVALTSVLMAMIF